MSKKGGRLCRAIAIAAAAVGSVAVAACAGAGTPGQPAARPAATKAFLDHVNATMLKLGIAQSRAGWIQQTYITDDTDAIHSNAY